MGLRDHAPELWAGIVGWCREIGLDWPEDDIASVMGKVHAKEPDQIPDAIGHVLHWCSIAQKSDDEEAVATVEIWRQLPVDLIVITLDENNRPMHQINPDVDVKFVGAE